jgi:chromosome segregation ATPase
LRELLATAETAPAPEKIEADITRLRLELTSEQQKQSALSNQIAKNDAAIQARDKTLGLTDLKITVQTTIQEAEVIAQREDKVHHQMGNLEQQVASAQVRLLKLQARDKQIWGSSRFIVGRDRAFRKRKGCESGNS